MADLVQNAALVAAVSPPAGQNQLSVTGEAMTSGTPIYQTNASNGYWFKANSFNGRLAGNNTGIRITLGASDGAGQPVNAMIFGRINLGGAILEPGETYVLSINTGKICPIGDLQTNQFCTILGTALDNTNLQMPASGAFPGNTARQSNVA